MCTKEDMIELAQRRSSITKRVQQKKQRQIEVIKSHSLYQTIKEIAQNQHKTPDQVRYLMKDEKPTPINLGQSHAYGYTMEQIAIHFPPAQ